MMEAAVQPATNESGDPGAAPQVRSSSRWSVTLQVCGIAVVFLSALAGHALWRTGSPGLVWPYLAGQRLFFEPTQMTLGEVPRGTQEVQREVRVLNAGSNAIRLLGAQRSCGCIALDEFPITVPAGEEKSLRLKIGMPREPAPFEHSIKFFSDERGSSSVVVKIDGFVP